MDHERFGALARFAKDIEGLYDLCQKFKETISSGKSNFPPVGNVSVEDGVVLVKTLGHNFRSIERIVLSENSTPFVEFSFVTGEGDAEYRLISCYMSTGGTVFTEPSFDNKLCDFNNSYSAEHLLIFVANALVNSNLFKPSTEATHD